jgi:hypothetical protein
MSNGGGTKFTFRITVPELEIEAEKDIIADTYEDARYKVDVDMNEISTQLLKKMDDDPISGGRFSIELITEVPLPWMN